ncbi:MAG: hemolysin III family protein [Pirellulaceae bacterium]|nr:hemolysin III family protein [Pirellulaceae bacterium]
MALMGLGALLAISIQIGDPVLVFSFSVFGIALVLMYAMSTLYHSFRMPRLKDLFQLFDHIAIYVLIAGTYTPYTLISLRDGNGWRIFLVVWALAAVGIISELFLSGRLIKFGQMLIYLGMGWVGAIELSNLRVTISDVGLYWLIAGGISYTLGAAFYLLDKARMLTHAHGIWHFFVLLGSVCHFVSTIGYVR